MFGIATHTQLKCIPKWKQVHVDKGAKKANGSLVTAADIGKNRFELGDTALFIPGPGQDAKWLADEKLKIRYTVITQKKASYPASSLATTDPNYYPSDPFFLMNGYSRRSQNSLTRRDRRFNMSRVRAIGSYETGGCFYCFVLRLASKTAILMELPLI